MQLNINSREYHLNKLQFKQLDSEEKVCLDVSISNFNTLLKQFTVNSPDTIYTLHCQMLTAEKKYVTMHANVKIVQYKAMGLFRFEIVTIEYSATPIKEYELPPLDMCGINVTA